MNTGRPDEFGGRPHANRRSRLVRRLAQCCAVTVLMAIVSSGVAAPAVQAAAPAPRLRVLLRPDLGCDISHRDDPRLAFFDASPGGVEQSIAACGTFVSVDGVLFGPRASGAFAADQRPLTLTPISQTATTGNGTVAHPFRVMTKVAVGRTGVIVAQTDTWTSTGEIVRSRIDINNRSAARRTVVIYRAGDCQADTYQAFGAVRASKAACLVADQDGFKRDIGRLVPGDAIVQFAGVGGAGISDTHSNAGFGATMGAALRAGTLFGGTCIGCSSTAASDRTVGLSWSLRLAAGGWSTIRSTLTMSTGASRPRPTLTAVVSAAKPETVTATLRAPRAALVRGQVIRFLRDGTQVCSAVTDRFGVARCAVAQHLGSGDPAAAALALSPTVEVMYDGGLDLRPAVTTVSFGPEPNDPGTLPPPTCLPPAEEPMSLAPRAATIRLVAPSCPSVRYALVCADGNVAVYVPGDARPNVDIVFQELPPCTAGGPTATRFVVTRFRQPSVVLASHPFIGSSPGKLRG